MTKTTANFSFQPPLMLYDTKSIQKGYIDIRLGVISKMDLSTLQYFTFALKSKANTKMLH